MWELLALLACIVVGLYLACLLFVDSLDKFQAPFNGKLRIYWVSKYAYKGTPIIATDSVIQAGWDIDSDECWRGRGITVRWLPTRTFQFGVLTGKEAWWRELDDHELAEAKKWSRPDWVAYMSAGSTHDERKALIEAQAKQGVEQ